MPLVLATDAPTVWDADYADITGVQYEFPERYRSYVTPGEQFVYYRGVRSGQSGYFGEGVIGSVRPGSRPDQLIADVLDVALFDEIVPIRDVAGVYMETGSVKGTNWANGVRRIDAAAFERISGTGLRAPALPMSSSYWPGHEHASRLERYSVAVAMNLLEAEFGRGSATEMPAGNPGYDISVERAGDEPLHVEVKGTVLPAPAFHLSEGQRRHAEARGDGFRLIVVYAVQARHGRHKVSQCSGFELESRATLSPHSWLGVLGE